MNYIFKRFLTSIFLILIIYFSLKNSIILFLFLFLINFFAIYEFKQLFTNIFKKKINLIMLSLLFSLIYLGIFSIMIWIFLFKSDYSQVVTLIFLLSICIFTDTGGFVTGKLIGGKKLTKISPNKTYSGMLGSFVFSLVFGYLFYNFQENNLDFRPNLLFLIFILSFASQIGDLFISFLKRKAKIKDTGSILPGHGGILDRIDGILIALPIGMILVSI